MGHAGQLMDDVLDVKLKLVEVLAGHDHTMRRTAEHRDDVSMDVRPMQQLQAGEYPEVGVGRFSRCARWTSKTAIIESAQRKWRWHAQQDPLDHMDDHTESAATRRSVS